MLHEQLSSLHSQSGLCDSHGDVVQSPVNLDNTAKVYAWVMAACFHLRGFVMVDGALHKAALKRYESEAKRVDLAMLLPSAWVSGKNQDVFNLVFDHPDLMGSFEVKCITMMDKIFIFHAKLTRLDLEYPQSPHTPTSLQQFQFKLNMDSKRIKTFQDFTNEDAELLMSALDVNVFQKLDVGLSNSLRVEVEQSRAIFDFVVTQWSPASRIELIVLAAHSVLCRDGFFLSVLVNKAQPHPAVLPDGWRDGKSFTFEYFHSAYFHENHPTKTFLIKFVCLQDSVVVTCKAKDDGLTRCPSIMWKFNMNRFVEKDLNVFTASCFRGFAKFVSMVSNGVSKRLITPQGANADTNQLAQLPVEILVNLLMFLDSKSLVKVELTSAALKSVANSSAIWKVSSLQDRIFD
jgi:hypothetical protein